MKKIFRMLALAAVVCLAGCNNDVEDLEREIDALKSRVTALESQVEVLNDNIEALDALAQTGATITEATLQEDGTWKIVLSNGQEITLKQGSEAEAVIPVMGIDADGYWVVDYRDGAGFVQILVDGQPVKANATDGVTPLFRIDADGYWEVSYNAGESYEKVLGADGQPVSAIGTGEVTDKFFADVKKEGDCLYVELLTGEKLYIPILPDFYCRIVAPEGVQKFTPLQSIVYDVEIKGVEQVFMTAPDGWKVQLSDAIQEKALLTVTAPESVRSLADNTKDVAILALAGEYATISKIQVELEGGAVVTPPTVESVAAVEAATTDTSLQFTVAVSEDADSWKWLLKKSSEEAPNASTIAVTGTTGTEATVVATGLEALTEYTLYVVAIKAPSVYSEVKSATATTAAPKPDYTDYYEEGVTIDGVIYNKENAILVTETTTISAEGVYFLDPVDGASISMAATGDNGLGKLVVIGRYSNKKPLVTLSGCVSMNAKSGATDGFVFKNIKLDASAFNNYIFNFGATLGTFERLIFEDCEIAMPTDKPLTYFNAASGINRVILRNNKIRFALTADNTTSNLINLGGKALVSTMTKVLFENNVIYSSNDYVGNGMFFNLASQANTNLTVEIIGNTIVNIAGRANGYVQTGGLAKLKIAKNIFWATPTCTLTSYFAKFGKASDTELDVTDNVIYGISEKGKWSSLTSSNWHSTVGEAKPALVVEDSDPFASKDFATGSFVPVSDFAGYGSTLE